MTDTARTKSAMAALLADNTAQDISAQDLRDGFESVANPVDNGGFGYGYHPDWPPNSPHSNDDEFNDASLSGSWTEWDYGSIVTVSEGAYGLKIVNTGTGQFGGVYRTLPASPWAIVTKVSLVTQRANYPKAAIALLENGASSSGDLIAFELGQVSAVNRIVLETFTDYNTFSSGQIDDRNFAPTAAYLRIRRNGTTYSFDYSTDGLGWIQVYSNTIGLTPTHVALINAASSGNTTTSYFRFYRQTDSNAFDQPVPGRVFNVT